MRCWQFVAVDAQQGANRDDPPLPELAEFIEATLAFNPSEMQNVYTAFSQEKLHGAAAGWIPRQTDVSDLNPSDGAGQYRAVGRMMLLAKWSGSGGVLSVIERGAELGALCR